MDQLNRRLHRIERSNLVLKVLNVACAATLIGFARLPAIIAGSSAPKTLSAQEFVVVNSAGDVLAKLSAGKKAGALLTFVDPQGKQILSAGTFEDGTGAGVNLYDGNTIVPGHGVVREGLGMAVAPHPNPGIGASVYGPDGRLRVSWGALPDGTNPGFASYDSNGIVRTFSGIELDSRFVGHYVLDSTGAGRNGIQTDERDNFNGFFANDADGINRVAHFEALDGSIAFSAVNSSAGPLGARLTEFVTGDGSLGEFNIADSNGVGRVESFQAGQTQGVNTFDSSGNPSGSIP